MGSCIERRGLSETQGEVGVSVPPAYLMKSKLTSGNGPFLTIRTCRLVSYVDDKLEVRESDGGDGCTAKLSASQHLPVPAKSKACLRSLTFQSGKRKRVIC